MRVYPVADLAYTPGRDKRVTDLAPVRKLIETTVAPQTWKSAGGIGQIDLDSEKLVLISRQTPEVHQQIATLLRALRREQDVQVALELKLVRFTDRGWTSRLAWPETAERLVEGITLSRGRVDNFKKLEEFVKPDRARQFPKVTVFNEQIVEFKLSQEGDKLPQPLAIAMGVVVDNDRRGVRLNLSCNSTTREEALIGAHSFRLAEGDGLLIDVGPAAAAAQTIQQAPFLTKTPYLSRWFRNAQMQSNAGKPVQPLMLLVVPHIIVMAEEMEETAELAPH